MNIELREFEALGGKFSEEKMIKKGFRYKMYIGLLTIGNAKCIGYVKKLDNGAVIVTRMKNLSESNVVNKLHTVAAVLNNYIENEGRSEEIVMLQSKRKILNLIASVFQLDALIMGGINFYHYLNFPHNNYLILTGMGLFVFLLMVECRYRIKGLYILKRKNY